MKNLKTVITVLVLAFTFTVNAQNPYYTVEGRAQYSNTVTDLVTKLNRTNFPVYSNPNENFGRSYRISFFDGKSKEPVESGLVDMSNSICNSVRLHLSNPQTGHSLLSVCGSQAGKINSILNAGLLWEDSKSVDIQPLIAGQNETHSRLKRIDKRMDSITYNQDVIVDNQVAITKRMALNQQVLVDKLYEMTEIQLRTAKYARQGRNWAIAGTVFSAIGATAATVDVLNGDGNASNVAHYFNNITNTTNTTNNTTTIPPTTNPPTNGGGAGPAGNG